MTRTQKRHRRGTAGATETATESGARTPRPAPGVPPQTTALPLSRPFDVRDVLLFLAVVALVASIAWGLQQGGPLQVTNNRVDIGAKGDTGATGPLSPLLPDVVVVASVFFVSLVLVFIAYLVATGNSSEVKRLAPFLGIASFFVAAGGFIRFYPSDWSNGASSAFVIIGYSLAFFFLVKDFNMLPWEKKKQEVEDPIIKELRKMRLEIEESNNKNGRLPDTAEQTKEGE